PGRFAAGSPSPASGEGKANSGPERYRSSNLVQDLSGHPSADPLFGAAWAAAGVPRSSRSWNLPLVNGLAVAAIIAGVGYRLWAAHLPADVLREEAVLFAAGTLLAGVAVAVRVSKLAPRLAVQLPLMACAAILAVLVLGLGLLALLTSRAVERDLGVQVERQSSLLATLSDLGEGLVITERGRFVAGNDAYVNLTGYSREELAAMPSLIGMAPEEQREQLAANLSQRLAGGDVPARYTSAIITRS